jgi:hypothetical protein
LEKENKPSLKDFEFLHGFRDVFVGEIPKLPPRREIDFSIDLPLLRTKYQYSIENPQKKVLNALKKR